MPWRSLKYDTSLDGYRTSLTADRLKSAPKYSNDNSWNWEDPSRAKAVNDYYSCDRCETQSPPACDRLALPSPSMIRSTRSPMFAFSMPMRTPIGTTCHGSCWVLVPTGGLTEQGAPMRHILSAPSERRALGMNCFCALVVRDGCAPHQYVRKLTRRLPHQTVGGTSSAGWSA